MENYIKQIQGTSLIKAWLVDRYSILCYVTIYRNEFYLQILFPINRIYSSEPILTIYDNLEFWAP
jgi:hypothetical protein